VRLVVTPHETNATAVQEDQALIEVLAQGQRWFEQWLRGEVASLRAIAQSAGKSERHVSQVIRAAFLAPDLPRRCCRDAGRRSTVRGVMNELPWDWNEQRRRFGLAARVEAAGLWLYSNRRDSRLPDDERLTYAIGTAVLHLAPRTSHTAWVNGRPAKRYQRHSGRARGAFGQWLRDELGILFLRISQEIEMREHQARDRRKALGAPFDAR